MKSLKKLVSIFIILALGLLIVSGCNKNPAKSTSSAGSKTTTKTSTASKAANKSGTAAKSTVKGSTSATGEEDPDANVDGDSNEEQEVPGEDGNENDDTSGIVEESFDLGGIEIVIWDPHYPNVAGQELALGQRGTIGDALYYSMRDAETKYNCKIRSICKDGFYPDNSFATSVLAGIVPCTLFKNASNTILPSYALNNVVLPLDEYIDFNNPLLADMGADVEGLGLWRGKHYGYPHIDIKFGNNVANLVIYDRDALRRQGVEDFRDIEAQGRWDWDEMLSIAQQLTIDRNGDGIIDQYAISGNYGYAATLLLASNGARLITENDGKYGIGLEEPRFLRTMNFYNELMYVNKVIDTQYIYQWNAASLSMGLGRSVFALCPGWFAHNMKATTFKADRDLGWVMPPKGPDCDEILNEGGGGVYVIPATLANLPDAANIIKAAIDAVTAWDTGKSFWSEKLQLPEGIKAHMYITSNNGGYPVPQEDLDYFENNSKGYTGKIEFGFTEYLKIVNAQVLKMALGQVPPATGVEQIKAQAQTELDKFN